MYTTPPNCFYKTTYLPVCCTESRVSSLYNRQGARTVLAEATQAHPGTRPNRVICAEKTALKRAYIFTLKVQVYGIDTIALDMHLQFFLYKVIFEFKLFLTISQILNNSEVISTILNYSQLF